MHPNYDVFSVEISTDDEAMDKFQDVMDAYHKEMARHTEEVARRLNVDLMCANHVVYLRSRSRWTKELEDELIASYKEGNKPGLNDF